jgi:hypothetical protein
VDNKSVRSSIEMMCGQDGDRNAVDKGSGRWSGGEANRKAEGDVEVADLKLTSVVILKVGQVGLG